MVSETLEGKLDSFHTMKAVRETSFFETNGNFKLVKTYLKPKGYCVAIETPWNTTHIIASYGENQSTAGVEFNSYWKNLTEQNYKIVLTDKETAEIVPSKKK